MKKISIILLVFFLVCSASGKKITNVDDKIDAFEEKTKSHLMRTKGNTYYVNSSVTIDNGNGTSWDEAVDTLAEAVALCVDGHDDVIFIAPGHTETITAATTINVDGLTIICLGTSGVDSGLASKTAQFDFTTSTDAAIKITGTPITWVGGDFMCDIANQKQMFYIYTGNNFYIKDAVFRENESTGLTFIQCSTTDSVESCVTIENCYFYAPTAGNYGSAISIPSDQIGWTIKNNRVFGDFDNACINIPVGGNAQVNLLIADNVLTNTQSGQHAIKINGTGSTGIITRNAVSTDAEVTSIDAGGLAANNMGNTFALYATDATVTYDSTSAASVTAILADTALWDTTAEAQTILFGSATAGATATALATAQADLDLLDTSTELRTLIFGSDTAGSTATALAVVDAIADDMLTKVVLAGADTNDIQVKLAIVDAIADDMLTKVVLINTDTNDIQVKADDVQSKVVLINTDTNDIQVKADDIQTKVVLINTDTNSIEAKVDDALTKIILAGADTNDLQTKALDINGDTNDIISGLVGTYFSTTSIVESNDIPDNTQVAGAITGAASGTLLLTDIIVNTDATGWAAPTNIEFSTDNAFGNTGADLPVFVEVVASFGTNLTVSKKDATSHTLPIIIESGKKVFIHGDSAAGTGAGYGKVTLVFQRLTAGATITAADLDTD